MIEAILSRNHLTVSGLSAIAVATGPGSFTGIRIGLATVEGIALSTGIPAVGISTLEAMAAVCDSARPLAPLIDAGNGNVYYAKFRVSGATVERLCEDGFGTADEIPALLGGASFTGDGAVKYSAQLGSAAETILLNRSVAAGAALRAWVRMREGATGGEPMKPNYIRKSAAENALNL